MIHLAVLLAEVTAVFAVARLITLLASRARAAVRHLVLACAFGVALTLPLATLMSPTITVEIAALPARLPDPIIADPVMFPAAAPVEATPPDIEASPFVTTQLPRTLTWSIRAEMWLLFAWALVALITLLPVGKSLSHLRSIRRRARPWPGGTARLAQLLHPINARRPIVLLDDVIVAPITGGLIRPVIALPADAVAWSDIHFANALAHEVEHVRRRDWTIHLIARAVCALYWFHPLAWLSWRALRLEAERVCDDAALAGVDAASYAEQLLELARRVSDKQGMPGMQMASTSNLSSRIRGVLDSTLPRGRASRRVTACIVIAAIVSIATLAPLRAAGPKRTYAEPVATSSATTSPAPAMGLQPATTPFETPFPYDIRVGLVSLRDEGGCLSIFNSSIAAGTKLTLVRPRSTDQAVVMEATVGERQPGECPAGLDRRDDVGLDPTYYRIAVSGNRKPTYDQVFAVLDPLRPIVLRNGQIEADIDGDGLREFFGTCTSSENVHYVIWTQFPAQRRKRWHGNIYYPYDMEVSCIDDDVLVPLEKTGEAVNAASTQGAALAATDAARWYVTRPSATDRSVSIHYAPPNSVGDAVPYASFEQALTSLESENAVLQTVGLGYALNGDLLNMQQNIRSILATTWPQEYTALLRSASIPATWNEQSLRPRLRDAILRSGIVGQMKPALTKSCLQVRDVALEKAQVTLKAGVPQFNASVWLTVARCPEQRDVRAQSIIQLSPAQEAPKWIYTLSERPAKYPPAMVAVQISPVPTYDLPKTQMSFRLRIQNHSGETIDIRDPLPSIMLQAKAPDSGAVDIPQGPPGFMFKPADNDRYASPIHFKSAVLDGKEDLRDRDSYEIKPGSFLELVFECEPIVGERILAAVKDSSRPHVDLRIAILVHNLQDPQDSRGMISEFMRLPIPKP